MINEITLKLNGETQILDVNPLKRLLDVLREDCGLLGIKEGCGEGECGACSVLIDGVFMNACLYPVGKADGKEVITIEGLVGTENYEVLKESFEQAGAVQCGFCSPGMIMAAESLLRKNPHPSDHQIREAISGNLCRCTGYNMIVEAVQLASKRGEGLW